MLLSTVVRGEHVRDVSSGQPLTALAATTTTPLNSRTDNMRQQPRDYIGTIRDWHSNHTSLAFYADGYARRRLREGVSSQMPRSEGRKESMQK